MDALRLDRRPYYREVFAAIAGLVLITLFYLFFSATSRRDAIETARTEADQRAALETNALIAEINKFRILPFVLTELPDVHEALANRSPAAQVRLNETLSAVARQTGASSIFAVDANGTARASSNHDQPDSFVNHDFKFRPYFQIATREGAAEYFAAGAVTGRAGLFLARRIGSPTNPIGVIVVKIEFDAIARLWRSEGPLSFVADRHGIIIVSSDPALRYQVIGPSDRSRIAAVARTQQFGLRDLQPAPLRFINRETVVDNDGVRYLASIRALPLLGWHHILLEPERPAIVATRARVRLVTLLMALGVMAMLTLFFWSATRRRLQAAARDALEAEVLRRTAELREAHASLQQEARNREEADSRYRVAREALAQANRLGLIGTITTSVAHELNQPVAAIRTAAENAVKLLARDDPTRVDVNLKLIISLTQRIGTITGELQSYARRGRGKAGATHLQDVLDGAMMLIGDSFRRAGVALKIDRPKDLPTLPVARIRIEQVLVNLLQNALEAVTNQQDAMVRLKINLWAAEMWITISDNGPGIPPDLGETIFQSFVTGRPSGTGLGLGIAREIVQEYGGKLSTIPSELGGATFRIVLPLSNRGST